jgi:putative ABC transport system permease protein
MNIWVGIRISYRALKKNRVRSILTTLGIIIGIAAVITMVAITQGAKELIEQQLTNLGGKSLIINPGKRTGSGVTSTETIKLTEGDAEAIKKLNTVTHVSPILDTTGYVVWSNRSWFTAIVGTSPDFVFINDWFPERGNYFTEEDIKNAERVCVLGKTVASRIFGYQNPIGKTVRIEDISFRVIGVMSSLGQTPGGKDQDDIVLVPYTTLQKRVMGIEYVENISVSVRTPEDIPFAEVQITKLLRERHALNSSREDGFYIKTQLNIIERILTISKIMTILLGSIASISLIVGGIGIMNIMLVSVTERTKEIGIRMAVGAKEKDILLQFLIEAVLLSIAGGVLGIMVGVIGSKLSSLLTNWPVFISPLSILISFCFAAAIGIFFGLYPARKASKLNPIDALRYE